MRTYDTRDIYLAVALFSTGHNLLNVDKANPRRAVFVFEHDSTIEDHVELFFMHKLPNDTRSILENLKSLKDMLYAGV
jgi:hypothetical protein